MEAWQAPFANIFSLNVVWLKTEWLCLQLQLTDQFISSQPVDSSFWNLSRFFCVKPRRIVQCSLILLTLKAPPFIFLRQNFKKKKVLEICFTFLDKHVQQVRVAGLWTWRWLAVNRWDQHFAFVCSPLGTNHGVCDCCTRCVQPREGWQRGIKPLYRQKYWRWKPNIYLALDFGCVGNLEMSSTGPRDTHPPIPSEGSECFWKN